MPLTVLSNSAVTALLQALDAQGVLSFATTLQDAFGAYSVGRERQYQVDRQAITRPGGPTMLFMPAILPSGSSVKVVGVPPPQASAAEAKPLRGVLAVCDGDGRCDGLLNSEEFTAFRTALGSMLAFRHRARADSVVVFGAGKQALWHLWLALVLRRRGDIRSVTIVNRSAERPRRLIDRLREMDSSAKLGVVDDVAFSVIATEAQAHETQLRGAVEQADVVFCTTPSTEPLFPAEWLLSDVGRAKTRFISAVGSFKLDMMEMDPELLRTVAAVCRPGGDYKPFFAAENEDSFSSGGRVLVIVDSREACAVEAGELVAAGLQEDQLAEIGELVHLQNNGTAEDKGRMLRWLQEGSVIYKSVGVGIMDLSLGRAVLELGRREKVGSYIDEF